MIDITKKYKTNSGLEVKLYCTDADSSTPVHGAYKNHDGDWIVCAWTSDGVVMGGLSSIHGSMAYDLMEVPLFEAILESFEYRLVNVYGLTISVPRKAKYIAVDENGAIYSYEVKPFVEEGGLVWNLPDDECWVLGEHGSIEYIGDWTKSLIEI